MQPKENLNKYSYVHNKTRKMRKLRKAGVYLDYLHKGAVCTCFAATLYGLTYLSYRAFHYYSNVKPQIKIKMEAENKKLLAEGSSEAFHDTAPTLKMQ